MSDYQRFYFCTGPSVVAGFDSPTDKGLVRVTYRPADREVKNVLSVWCKFDGALDKELRNALDAGEVIAAEGYAVEDEPGSGKHFHHACRVFHGDMASLPRAHLAKDHTPATDDGRVIQSFDRDTMICRQSALKSAVVQFQGCFDVPAATVLATAETFYQWIVGSVHVPQKSQTGSEPPKPTKEQPVKPAWIDEYTAKLNAAKVLSLVEALSVEIGKLARDKTKTSPEQLAAFNNDILTLGKLRDARKAALAPPPTTGAGREALDKIAEKLVEDFGFDKVAAMVKELGTPLDKCDLKQLNLIREGLGVKS